MSDKTALPEMQRYDLVTYYRGGTSIEEMERSDDGEWVRWDGLLAATDRIRTEHHAWDKARVAELQRLRSERDEAKAQFDRHVEWAGQQDRIAGAQIQRLGREHDALRTALQVIHKCVRGDEHAEWWTIRKWLDDRGVFNDDLGSFERIVDAVCVFALAESPTQETQP